jgi:hypothetical protein
MDQKLNCPVNNTVTQLSSSAALGPREESFLCWLVLSFVRRLEGVLLYRTKVTAQDLTESDRREDKVRYRLFEQK